MVTPTHWHSKRCWWNFEQARWVCIADPDVVTFAARPVDEKAVPMVARRRTAVAAQVAGRYATG